MTALSRLIKLNPELKDLEFPCFDVQEKIKKYFDEINLKINNI